MKNDSEKKRLILLAPPFRGKSVLKYLRPSDQIILIDGALDLLYKNKLFKGKVIAWIGDGDSSSLVAKQSSFFKEIPEKVLLPKEKHQTDFFYALRWAMKKKLNYNEWVVMGAWGGRIDHHLAAIEDLRTVVEKVTSLDWINRINWISGIDQSKAFWLSFGRRAKRVKINLGKQATFSLFGSAFVENLIGCKYLLKNKVVGWSGATVSNYMMKDILQIQARAGEILVVVANEARSVQS